METVTTTTVCEAATGMAPNDFGFANLWCNQTRGLRSFRDGSGMEHHYCPATGHETAVRRRFGSLRTFPEQADPITAAKGREWVQDHGGYVLVIDEAPE